MQFEIQTIRLQKKQIITMQFESYNFKLHSYYLQIII